MTSATVLASCAGPGYLRRLSAGCADSGDFGAGHYVRTALLALPGGRGARQVAWIPVVPRASREANTSVFPGKRSWLGVRCIFCVPGSGLGLGGFGGQG